MDRPLSKFILTCLVCEVIGYAAAAPLQDSFFGFPTTFQRPAPTTERSSLFGLGSFGLPFSAPDPISIAQSTFTGFGSLFSPAGSNQNNEKLIEPTADQNVIPNTNPSKNDNLNKNTNFVPAEVLVPSNIALNKNQEKESAQNADKRKDGTNPFNGKQNSDDTNKEEEKIEVDKAIVEALFKEISENEITSTENPADYTTETGDYESTTEDFLRIPPAAVASLLG